MLDGVGVGGGAPTWGFHPGTPFISLIELLRRCLKSVKFAA
jgi:hypothetical protein